MVIHRRQLRDTLSNLCRLLTNAPAVMAVAVPEPPPIENLPVPVNM
jgi:hypothetical protein